MMRTGPTWPDDELVAALKAHDEEAAAEFVRRFQPVITRLARRGHVPFEDCADVAQDALNEGVRQIRDGRFRGGPTKLSTWLYVIFKGAVANYFRRLPDALRLDLDQVRERDLVAASEFTLEDVLWVRQALESLSAGDRFILRLHELEQFTLEEIGHEIGRKKSVLGERLNRARKNFRLALRGGGTSPSTKRLKE